MGQRPVGTRTYFPASEYASESSTDMRHWSMIVSEGIGYPPPTEVDKRMSDGATHALSCPGSSIHNRIA